MGIALDQRLVDEIVRRICGTTQPDRIILFGSAAMGRMTRDSDIDVLVLHPNPGNTRDACVRIGDALRGLGYAFDVLVMATERFEESKDVIGGIAYPVNRTGQVIDAAA